MILRIVKMHFQPDQVPEFLELFYRHKAMIRGFEGCLHLELKQDLHCPEIFFTLSHWESDAHLQAYRQSELFNTVWERTRVLFREKPEAWSLTPAPQPNL